MKQVSILSMLLIFAGMAQVSFADNNGSMGEMKHSMNDERISLGLSPKMKQHQLANMRSHVEAVQAITGLIAEKEFEKASEVAHSKLGLTEEMRMMCNMFDNEKFISLGLAFHESGDALGETLKSKDTQESLRALQTTLGYCVQCHATFRQ